MSSPPYAGGGRQPGDLSPRTTAPGRRQPGPRRIAPARELVERWWSDHFPGSPVAQVTAAWNHAFAAKEELKRRLKRLAVREGH